jgi:excisionase family DNA binding protein
VPRRRQTSAPIQLQGAHSRGRYLTLTEAAEEYPIFSQRLLRRLVQERRIAFSRAGRTVVLAESDIHDYLEHNRVEAAG